MRTSQGRLGASGLGLLCCGAKNVAIAVRQPQVPRRALKGKVQNLAFRGLRSYEFGPGCCEDVKFSLEGLGFLGRGLVRGFRACFSRFTEAVSSLRAASDTKFRA